MDIAIDINKTVVFCELSNIEKIEGRYQWILREKDTFWPFEILYLMLVMLKIALKAVSPIIPPNKLSKSVILLINLCFSYVVTLLKLVSLLNN